MRRLARAVRTLVLLSGCTGGGSAAPTPVAPRLSPGSRPSPPPAPAAPVTFDAIAFLSANEGWAVGRSSALPGTGLFASHTPDGGRTWSPAVPVTSGSYPSTTPVAVRFADALHGWVSGPGLFETTDGGRTWKDRTQEGLTGPVAFAGGTAWDLQYPCGSTACSPVLMESSAGGSPARRADHQPPLVNGRSSLVRVSRAVAFVVGVSTPYPSSPTLAKTTDGGVTWTSLHNPCGTPSAAELATLDGFHVWMACGYDPAAGSEGHAVFVSADGGATWQVQSSTGVAGSDAPAPKGNLGAQGYLTGLTVSSPTTVFVALRRGGVFRSGDGGVSWTRTGITDSTGAGFGDIWFVDPMHGWAATCCGGGAAYGWPGLYRTTDGGLTWAQIATSP